MVLGFHGPLNLESRNWPRLKHIGSQEHRFCLSDCHSSEGLVVISSGDYLGAKSCITSLELTLVNETQDKSLKRAYSNNSTVTPSHYQWTLVHKVFVDVCRVRKSRTL